MARVLHVRLAGGGGSHDHHGEATVLQLQDNDVLLPQIVMMQLCCHHNYNGVTITPVSPWSIVHEVQYEAEGEAGEARKEEVEVVQNAERGLGHLLRGDPSRARSSGWVAPDKIVAQRGN
jgi:hypothetical protein